MINKKHLMNLEGLVLLAAISQYGGKRKAAEAMNTSIDTVNKYIENLEKEVCYKLLVSDGRGSYLTPRAEELVKQVKGIEDIFNEIYISNSCSVDFKGEVRLGIHLGVSVCLSPQNIGDFFDKYPDITIHSNTSLDSFNINSMDLDIGITLEKPNSADSVVIHSKKVECGYFATPEYLAKHGYPKDMEDMLENHRLVNKYTFDDTIKDWKELKKKAKHICYSSNSLYCMVDNLKNGIGIGIMPMLFKDRGMICIDNIKCSSDVTFYLVAHKDTKDIPRIRVVLELYKELLERM